MLGISPYMTRAELLRQKHSGVVPEVDAETQRRFDDGHRFEEQARPWAEEIIGKDLYPASISCEAQGLPLAASLDGLTMTGDKAWEHKTLNNTIRDAADNNEIPEYIRVQMEHQMLVSGAEKCLFMASNGDRDTVVDLWYESQPEVRQKILDGWELFQKDLEAYTPPKTKAEAVGSRPESLPALNLQVEAKVLATNIDTFREHAIAVFDGISTDLKTDQDFADAESAVKFCKDVEDRLNAAKDNALSQAEDLYRVLSSIDDVSEAARQKRLSLKKLVDSRKSEIRTEIADEARAKFVAHMESLSERVRPISMPAVATDFAGAMKGKRTIKSLRDAVDQVLTDAKLEANEIADRIDANLRVYRELADGREHLFPDLDDLAQKAPDDFKAAVKLRIAEDEKAQAERAERERQREEAEREIEERRQRHEAEEKARRDAGKCDGNHGEPPCDDPECWLRTAHPDSAKGDPRVRTKNVTLVATFSTIVDESRSNEEIRAALERKLRAAGFQTLQSVEARSNKEVA